MYRSARVKRTLPCKRDDPGGGPMRLSTIVLLACAVPFVATTDPRVLPALPSDSSNDSATLQVTMEAKTEFPGGLAGKADCDPQRHIFLRPAGDETSKKYHPVSALPI